MPLHLNLTKRFLHSWPLIVLGLLIIALYQNILERWWTWDDTFILKQAYNYSPWQYFWLPEIWREQSAGFLTPWFTLSFDFDLSLFGLNPSAFYTHQLLAFWFTTIATYFLLRLWLNKGWSFVGATLFILSAPTTGVVYHLWTRHYLEGLLFAILALYFYIRALREERLAWTSLGSLFYFLAMSAKELYVPLIGLLLFLPERDIQRRMVHALPFVMMLMIYALWRAYMLGIWVGGYGHSLEWSAILWLPVQLFNLILGTDLLGIIATVFVISLLSYALWRYTTLLLVSVFLLIGPIVSMAPFVVEQHRVLFGIGWALSIAIVLILGTIARDKLYKIGLAGILLVVLAASLFNQSGQMRSSHLFNVDNHFATEGRFLWQGDQKQALFLTPDYQTFYIHLSWLKKQIVGENAPKLILDEIDLLGLETEGLQLYRYAPSCQCITEISDQIPHLIAAGKAHLQNKPLSVDFSYQAGYFKWQFGPYQTGVYSLIEYPFFGKIPLPPSKELLWCQVNSLSFRIRYDSPEGWTTYSPLFELGEEIGKRVVWER
ncbi:MAG: hypothetical protein VSS75_000290 [Candidatus Parabeggiatoa sp.]|nr:hypothetical protein [Candidatus Parabeggiatoa sp.]